MPSVCVSQISMSSPTLPTLPREPQIFIANCLLGLSFIQISHRPLTLINIKATLLILTLASSFYNSLYQSMATPSFQVPTPKMLVILSSFPSTTHSFSLSTHKLAMPPSLSLLSPRPKSFSSAHHYDSTLQHLSRCINSPHLHFLIHSCFPAICYQLSSQNDDNSCQSSAQNLQWISTHLD